MVIDWRFPYDQRREILGKMITINAWLQGPCDPKDLPIEMWADVVGMLQRCVLVGESWVSV